MYTAAEPGSQGNLIRVNPCFGRFHKYVIKREAPFRFGQSVQESHFDHRGRVYVGYAYYISLWVASIVRFSEKLTIKSL